jgi:hypothetical protein
MGIAQKTSVTSVFLPKFPRKQKREPERFFVVQTALLESGDGVAQVRFQFTPVVG